MIAFLQRRWEWYKGHALKAPVGVALVTAVLLCALAWAFPMVVFGIFIVVLTTVVIRGVIYVMTEEW